MSNTLYHFWYSEEMERRELEGFCVAVEFGYVTSFDIPHYRTCKLTVGGETVELPYTCCHNERECPMYEEAGATYLGAGTIAKVRSMSIGEIIEKMKGLGMIIPSAVERMGR